MKQSKVVLPESIQKLFWDIDPSSLDLERHKKELIVRILNYGRLDDWHWLMHQYGAEEILKVINSLRTGSLREGVKRLIALLIG